MLWLLNIFVLFSSPWIWIPNPDPEDPWIRIRNTDYDPALVQLVKMLFTALAKAVSNSFSLKKKSFYIEYRYILTPFLLH